MSIQKNLRTAIDRAGSSNTKLANALGVSVQAVGKWLRTGKISRENLFAAAQHLGVSVDDLVREGRPMGVGETVGHYSTGAFDDAPSFDRRIDFEDPAGAADDPRDNGHVPLISEVEAGDPTLAIDLYAPGDAEAWIHCPYKHSKNTYALRIHGHSMTALDGQSRSYPDGTIVFCDPEQRGGVGNGDVIIAKINGVDAATCKVLRFDAGRKFLEPINKGYLPNFEEFRPLAKVINDREHQLPTEE